MTPLRTVLSLALVGLASSAAQFGGSRHPSTLRRTGTHFSVAQPSSRFTPPRATTATTSFHAPAAQTAFRAASPSFHNSAQTFRSSAPSAHNSAQTFRSSAPSFHNSAPTSHGSAPAFHNSVQTSHGSATSFHNSAPTSHGSATSFHNSAPTSHSSAPAFRNSAPSFQNSATSFRNSAPSSFQSGASTFKSSAPSSFKSSAPSSFQNSAPTSFKSSAPSSFSTSAAPFKSSAPSSSGTKQSFGVSSGTGTSTSKLVGRQRIPVAATTGQNQRTHESRQLSATRQAVRSFVQEATKYYASWTGGSHRTYTWDEADHECRRFGLRLVSLTSFEKETEISRLLNNAPFPVAHYWTSATKQGPNGGFMWGDRKHTPVCKPGSHAKVCHENWGRVGQRRGSTQPDDAEGHENCVAVLNRFYPGDGITWHDTPCHQEKHFVCEPY